MYILGKGYLGGGWEIIKEHLRACKRINGGFGYIGS